MTRLVSGLLLALVLAGALWLRAGGMSFGLPILVHPDEGQIVGPAARIVESGDPDPKTFLYPSLLIYTDAAAYAALDPADDVARHRIGRAVTVAFGVATVALAAACAAGLAGPVAAVVAAALVAVSELHVANSLPVTTDVPMGLFVLLSAFFSLRIVQLGGRTADYLAAGVSAGLAASTKYNGAFAALPIVVAHFASAPFPRALADWRLLLAGGATVAGFFLGTPYALVDRESFVRFLEFQRDAYRLGHAGAEDGPTSYAFYAGVLQAKFGALPLAAAAAGLAALLVRAPRLALVLAAFPAAYFAFMGAYPVRFERNAAALVAFAAVAAGCAAGLAWRRHLALGVAAVAVVAWGAYGQLAQSRAYTAFVTLPNTRWIAKLWIDENLPAGSCVAREFYTPPVDDRKFEVIETGYYGLIRDPEVDDCEYAVASSEDFGRFVNHADRYPREAAAYRRLFESRELVKDFRSDWLTSSGPEIRIYKRSSAQPGK